MTAHDQPAPGMDDPRSADDRRLDAEIGALFREAGLALSNGYQPELLGADSRHRAAEEQSIANLFQTAQALQTGPSPDFQQMAARARKLAQDRAGSQQDEELVGEMTRDTLRQLPDLEVRCWHVSQASAMVVETAQPAAPRTTPAVGTPALAAPAAAEAAEPLGAAVRPGEFTARDMANIRENNWAEFKRRYHRERRRQVLQMAVAGALGAAACFAVIWVGGLLNHLRNPAQPAQVPTTAAQFGDTGPGIAPGPRPLSDWLAADRATARDAAETRLADRDRDESVHPVLTDFGWQERDWILHNGALVGVDTASTDDPFRMPKIIRERPEPNPSRRLGDLMAGARHNANDSIAPELFPDATHGLRVIRLSPRSDFAQASLTVNDWIIRVIKPDGAELDLTNGSADNLRQWQEFLRAQHAGSEFDVEYVRGNLIRRTTVALSGDSR